MRLNVSLLRVSSRSAVRRVSIACVLVGMTSILAAPLATAQQDEWPLDTEWAPSDIQSTIAARDSDDGANACPAGYELSADQQICLAEPTSGIQADAPACDVGLLSPDQTFCFDRILIPGEAISSVESIPALPSCPGIRLVTADLGCVWPPAVEEGAGYCDDGSDAIDGAFCEVAGEFVAPTAATVGEPARPATAPSCPAGTIADLIVAGYCIVEDAEAFSPPCLPNELALAGPDGSDLCYAALPVTPGEPAFEGRPGTPVIPATCNGVTFEGPEALCFGLDAALVNDCLTGSRPTLGSGGETCEPIIDPDALFVPVEFTCLEGYLGPTDALACERLVLTAGPPILECGDLDDREVDGLEACVLPNEPVPGGLTTVLNCAFGVLSAASGLCELPAEPKVPVSLDPPGFHGPVDPGGPFVDFVGLAFYALGDVSAAPAEWVVDVTSNCLPDTLVLTMTLDAGFGISGFGVDDAAPDGAPCSYTVIARAPDGWLSSLGADGFTFVPSQTGAPHIEYEMYQPGIGQIYLSHSVHNDGDFAGESPARFTISGPCLDAPLAVELNGAEFSYELVAVPWLDAVGRACEYSVEASPTPGLVPNEDSITVSMQSKVQIVEFTSAPGSNPHEPVGSLEIAKSAEGDSLLAPSEWTFTVDSECLAETIVASIPTAPTFAGFASVVIDELPVGNEAGPCFYTVSELPADGFVPHPSYVVNFENAVSVQTNFYNQPVTPSGGTIQVTVFAPGAPDGTGVVIDITSPCLDSSIGLALGFHNSVATYDVDNVPATIDGEPCQYTIAVSDIVGFHSGLGLGGVIEFENGNDFVAVFFEVPSSVEIAQDPADMALALDLRVLGDPANAPALFSIALDSTCLGEPTVIDFAAIYAFTIANSPYPGVIFGLPTVDDQGQPCLYSVDLVNGDGYFVQGTGTYAVSPSGQPTTVVELALTEIGLAIGEVQIFKKATGDSALAPDLWEFTITSPCFDPITATMETEPTFGPFGDSVVVSGLPVTDTNGFCEITVTESPIALFTPTETFTFTFAFGSLAVHQKATAAILDVAPAAPGPAVPAGPVIPAGPIINVAPNINQPVAAARPSASPVTVASTAVASTAVAAAAPATPARLLGTGNAEPGLAHTGGEARLLTGFGLTLVMAGAGLMIAARRREAELMPDPFA